MPTLNELKMLQALPLEIKVLKTQQRIREWIDYYGLENVAVSFSGGKDSTVLLHIARQLYPNIEAIFVNTGLEFPEIQKFVKTFDNINIIRPKMMFADVIKKYGYPIVSKEVSQRVYGAKNKPNGTGMKILKGEYYKNEILKAKYNCEKYLPLVNAPFKVSHMCCSVMKKSPTKSTHKISITAQLAEESLLRTQKWLQNGCNGFNMKQPISNPMSFWTEQDILHYIKLNNIPLASVYGDLVYCDKDGHEYDNSLIPNCKLKCTGCHRTGCIFCAFGAHHDTRFLDLKKTHPRQYDYCINGGEFIDGIWQPNEKGLGMGFVFDWCNENIKNFKIQY